MKKLILALAVASLFSFAVSTPASASEYEETGESTTNCHNVSLSDCFNFATEEQEGSEAEPIFQETQAWAERFLRRHGWELHDNGEDDIYWHKPGHKLTVIYTLEDMRVCKFIDKHGGYEDSITTDDCRDSY